MNRTEAKTYALEVLGLDREQVRQFGNLSRTQTWLDAIAAQASGGIAAQASGGIAAIETSEQPSDPEPTPLTGLSFEAFWESPAVALNPQLLTGISELDEDWDDLSAPTSDPVVLYPIVIALLMLWAMLQMLLLLGHWMGMGLTALANYLDVAATKRLEAVSKSPDSQPNPQERIAWMLASP